jgi:two-component system chemotaxis response regulator CheY
MTISPAESSRGASALSMDSANFLVVEDSPTMRQLISFSLKRFKNARIIEAVDGVDALKKLSGPERIDLILTDINMPVMDGLKLVSLVRQNAQLKSIPIIIITTEGAEEDRERGLALGANAYISKPIQSSHLIKTISELLGSLS